MSYQASMMDLPDLVTIDGSGKSMMTHRHFIISVDKEVYISSDRKAYMMFEILHPGNKATLHFNSILKGKTAIKAFLSLVDTFFSDFSKVKYLLGIYPEKYKQLRFLAAKSKRGTLQCKIGDELVYTIGRK